jgi:hypothetical protein
VLDSTPGGQTGTFGGVGQHTWRTDRNIRWCRTAHLEDRQKHAASQHLPGPRVRLEQHTCRNHRHNDMR